MGLTYFKMYFSFRRSVLEHLTDAQRGRLLMALYDYAEHQTEPQGLDPLESMAFDTIRVWIDGNIKQYDVRTKANRENGKKGGRPAKEKTTPEKPNNPMGYAENPSVSAGLQEQPKPKNPKDRDKAKAKDKDKDKDKAMDKTKAKDRSAGEPAAKPPAPDGPPPPQPERFFGDNFPHAARYHFDQIAAYRDKGCSDALLLHAMQEALDHGAPSWNYVRKILDRCTAAGVFTDAGYAAIRSQKGPPGPGADFTGRGRNTRVDRPAPSGNDFVIASVGRPRRLKRTGASSAVAPPAGEVRP